MSDAVLRAIREEAEVTAVRVCWAQWTAFGSIATPAKDACPASLIDPEALILMSLSAQARERRLLDMVAWWAHVGSHLTSVQRLKAIADRFPADAGQKGLREFARMATNAGDRRWAKLAGSGAEEALRDIKGRDHPSLIEVAALWVRLRAGFGVGAKADVLAFLIGLRGAWATTREISIATGYSAVTCAKAASEMAQARLLRATTGRPVEYSAPEGPWAELLELYPSASQWDAPTQPRAPAWRSWSDIFSFLTGIIQWSRSDEEVGPHVIASRARDLIERHRRAFDFNGIDTPPDDAFRGLEAVQALKAIVTDVAQWSAGAV